ncbi:MAG TPA: DUF885 domain-containing protein [Myxococcales bacterium]|nr:DUF885 domain-containing protein [Myxococcales bacterium]
MRTLLATATLLLACSHAAPAPAPSAPASAAQAPSAGWIARSNQNAQLLLDVQAKFAPELAARTGVAGIDDRITDFNPGRRERQRQAIGQAVSVLEERQKAEQDPNVGEDLAILIDAGKRQIRGSELQESLQVSYTNLPRMIFTSVRALLEPQIAAGRRPAALVRVRKYAGIEQGYKPVVELAQAETREGLRKGLLPPSRIEVENDLQTGQFLIDGIDKLFTEYKIEGAEQHVATLHRQLEDYLKFVRIEVLPKAREDFRLPRELYEFQLRQVGVDITGEELAQRAHKGFEQIQGEMQQVAARVAKERGFPDPDYRAVIRELKKNQIPDAQVLDFYKGRLAQLEQIIREHKLVTLPSRPARIRIGTPAENAQQPAPHMQPPRLIGNTGEQGEFVLPLSMPGKVEQKYDDFNFDAAAWTLTAHEARPGHELQFASMVERGVSLARAVFAFNSVNAEGWGLYAEAITLPYMPDDGKLISLQLRLQRAARAFLDPELQMGKWTPESARELLQKEVGLSVAFATQEVDRYTFRAPAQATAYYYGYLRILDLREAAEKKLGSRFEPLGFHDTILAQGLLPPDLMKKAVLEQLQ